LRSIDSFVMLPLNSLLRHQNPFRITMGGCHVEQFT